MEDSDPYQGSKIRFALIGFSLGASLPVAMGLYVIQVERAHIAALPPNTGACGMGMLAGFALIFVASPCCGLIVAVMGWVTAAIAIR